MDFVLEESPASNILKVLLNNRPPKFLYHYTNPEGLIGIIKSKEMWATNIDYLNDSHEIEYCVDCAKGILDHMISNTVDQECEPVLSEMRNYVGAATKRYYLVSLSEESDSLPQWRAYCPAGGYALGIESEHLSKMAIEQGFRLVKCCYDYQKMYSVIREWINHFILKFKRMVSEGIQKEEAARHISWQFGQHIARYGSIFKHEAFSQEVEWRILSENVDEQNQKVEFRSREGTIVPYFRFPLVSQLCPNLHVQKDDGMSSINVRCSPLNNTGRSQITIQFLLRRYLGGGSWGPSNIPYKMK